MKAKRYDTIAPGPGAYRIQSEFGIYSPDDIKGVIDSRDIYSIVSSTMKNRPTFNTTTNYNKAKKTN